MITLAGICSYPTTSFGLPALPPLVASSFAWPLLSLFVSVLVHGNVPPLFFAAPQLPFFEILPPSSCSLRAFSPILLFLFELAPEININ